MIMQIIHHLLLWTNIKKIDKELFSGKIVKISVLSEGGFKKVYSLGDNAVACTRIEYDNNDNIVDEKVALYNIDEITYNAFTKVFDCISAKIVAPCIEKKFTPLSNKLLSNNYTSLDIDFLFQCLLLNCFLPIYSTKRLKEYLKDTLHAPTLGDGELYSEAEQDYHQNFIDGKYSIMSKHKYDNCYGHKCAMFINDMLKAVDDEDNIKTTKKCNGNNVFLNVDATSEHNSKYEHNFCNLHPLKETTNIRETKNWPMSVSGDIKRFGNYNYYEIKTGNCTNAKKTYKPHIILDGLK